MGRLRIGLVLLALAAVGTVAACTGTGDSKNGASAVPGSGGEVAVLEEPTAQTRDAEVGIAEDGSAALPPSTESALKPLELTGLASTDPRVIQNAALTLSVPKGSFEDAIDQARSIATAVGGFVTGSSASQGPDERLVRGTLVVRVPQRSYAQVMAQLSKLGKVEAREESGQDVSQQYVDLEARQRHLEAVERQLLAFLGKTTTVADALIVQDRLDQIQLQLEEVRGQLRYLDDQTSFATISMTVGEHGVVVTKTNDGGWGITDAWEAAAHGFLKVIGGAFVGIATAAPVLLALALAFFFGRYVIRRRQTHHTDSPAT